MRVFYTNTEIEQKTFQINAKLESGKIGKGTDEGSVKTFLGNAICEMYSHLLYQYVYICLLRIKKFMSLFPEKRS